jgi:hypothetical protein
MLRPGRLLRIHCGAYSDQQELGFFVVLREFDPREKARAAVAERKRMALRYLRPEHFVARLIDDGFLLELLPDTIYLAGEFLEESELTIFAEVQQC